MNSTPNSNRKHISIYGKTNAGKSSLINSLIGFSVNIFIISLTIVSVHGIGVNESSNKAKLRVISFVSSEFKDTKGLYSLVVSTLTPFE